MILVSQVCHARLILNLDLTFLVRGVDPEPTLKSLSCSVFKELSALGHHISQFVSNGFIQNSLQHDFDTLVEQLEEMILKHGHRFFDLVG